MEGPELPRVMPVRKRLLEGIRLAHVIAQLRGVRIVLATQQDHAIQVALLVAHDLRAPGVLKPVRVFDRDVVEVRPIVGVAGDQHGWPGLCVLGWNTLPLNLEARRSFCSECPDTPFDYADYCKQHNLCQTFLS